jgi:hypothetical protein
MRPQHQVKVGDHTFVLNDYITGGENWQIRQVYIAGVNVADGSTQVQAERKTFELVIYTMDGSFIEIADRVMALPLSEYKEVVAAINAVTETKKKSENSSPSTPVMDGSVETSSS